MTDKQINKWLRRQFSPLGWGLIGYYVLINVLSSIAMLWEGFRQMWKLISQGHFRWQELDLDAIAGNAWGYVAAILVGFVILYAWKGPEYWHNEVMAKERPMKASVFFPILCLCVGSHLVNSLWVSGLEWIFNQFDRSLLPLLESVSGDSNTLSMFLYASLLAPIAEELLFRGYLLRSLRPYGKRFAILGSAFLFGLFHGNLLQTPYAFLVGLVLGYVTVEYSIGWAVALHMFNNLVLADLLARVTAALPEAVYNAVTLGIFGSCALISGIVLIVKRHRIRAYRSSEWMDRRVLRCFFLNSGILLLTALMLANMVMILLV